MCVFSGCRIDKNIHRVGIALGSVGVALQRGKLLFVRQIKHTGTGLDYIEVEGHHPIEQVLSRCKPLGDTGAIFEFLADSLSINGHGAKPK